MACPICAGKGYRFENREGYDVVVPCECQQGSRIQKYLYEADIPKEYWGQTLQTHPKDGRKTLLAGGPARSRVKVSAGPGYHETASSQTLALRHCRALVEEYLQHFVHGQSTATRGLLLYGPCGIGKTCILATLLVDLVYAGLHDVLFVDYSHLMRRIRYSYQVKQGESEEVILGPITRAKVVVLDDLGGETTENLAWVQDIFGYILTERLALQLPTLISTNFPDELDFPPETKSHGSEGARTRTFLVDRIGVRLRSRLYEACPRLVMAGKDLRPLLNPEIAGGK
ncbi:MAG: ATP-binding protein [Acidobacteria bacterium]|nr:ATP-binding protein [Acidobacteriota bacterium]